MGKNTLYSDAENAFLLQNAHHYSYKVLSEMFYSKFGRNIKGTALKQYCRNRLGIRKPDLCGFKKGVLHSSTLAEGTESIVAGRIYVKTLARGKFSERFRPKAEVIYGGAPDGKILVFVDGNPLNCTLENIRCIDKSVHVKLAKNKWFMRDPLLIDTAIKWCELYFSLKD